MFEIGIVLKSNRRTESTVAADSDAELDYVPVCALTEDDSRQENQRRSFENKHDRNIVLYRHCHQQLQTLCLLPYAEIEVAKRCDTKSGNVVLDSESLRRLI